MSRAQPDRSSTLPSRSFVSQWTRATFALLLLATSACGVGSGTYCQSGPKYGTQCYAEPEIRGASAYEAPDHTDGEETNNASSSSTLRWR